YLDVFPVRVLTLLGHADDGVDLPCHVQVRHLVNGSLGFAGPRVPQQAAVDVVPVVDELVHLVVERRVHEWEGLSVHYFLSSSSLSMRSPTRRRTSGLLYSRHKPDGCGIT